MGQLGELDSKPSNTGNISLQLVAQHCCFANCKALLPVLPLPQANCRATNFSVASCSNMLHEVEVGSTFGNMLLQLAKLKCNIIL